MNAGNCKPKSSVCEFAYQNSAKHAKATPRITQRKASMSIFEVAAGSAGAAVDMSHPCVGRRIGEKYFIAQRSVAQAEFVF